MTWERGFRELKSYETKDEAYADFVRIWTSYYDDYPSYRLAKKWTGGDSTNDWLRIVHQKYAEYTASQ